MKVGSLVYIWSPRRQDFRLDITDFGVSAISRAESGVCADFPVFVAFSAIDCRRLGNSSEVWRWFLGFLF